MRAVQISRFGGPEVLEVVDRPEPHPTADQVRIRVHAVSVNASDPKMRRGELNFGQRLPMGIGTDVAGIVDEIGESVTDVAVGDRVFGVSDELAGAAEYATITHRAPMPALLGFADAAALPAAIETATRSLDQLRVSGGTTLFINGASGGVGSAATQLAVARGARVVGAASSANQHYLRLLGATPVVYGAGMIDRVRAAAPDGIDVALDIAGNGVLDELIELTGSRTAVITVADFAGARQHGVHFSNGFEDGPAFHALTTIGALIETGRFWLPVDRTFPIEQIAAAHSTIEAGGVRGRIVVTV